MKKSIYNNTVTVKDNEYLYYNSASGAIVWLDKDVYEAIENNNLTFINKDILDALEERGFVVYDAIDEYGRHMNRSKRFKIDKSSDLASFVIAPTMACNLRCVYCFEAGRYCSEKMSESTQNDVFNFITNSILSRDKKRLHISWFGGEPMMAYSVIQNLSSRLIEFCKKHNINYAATMITNATLLDETSIHELYEKYNIRNVQITIDGNNYWYKVLKKGTEENFKRVIENILLMSKTPITVSLRLNICKENVLAFKETIETLLSDKDFHAYIYPGKLMKYSDSDVFNEIGYEEMEEFKKYLREKLKNFQNIKLCTLKD